MRRRDAVRRPARLPLSFARRATPDRQIARVAVPGEVSEVLGHADFVAHAGEVDQHCRAVDIAALELPLGHAAAKRATSLTRLKPNQRTTPGSREGLILRTALV